MSRQRLLSKENGFNWDDAPASPKFEEGKEGAFLQREEPPILERQFSKLDSMDIRRWESLRRRTTGRLTVKTKIEQIRENYLDDKDEELFTGQLGNSNQ